VDLNNIHNNKSDNTLSTNNKENNTMIKIISFDYIY